MLEHSTIPPYLCALYSIEDGSNVEAAEIIRSVVMEEMLHMVLVANVLNAMGGAPSIGHAGFVPRYPTQLPYSDGRLVVQLRRFSPEAVDTFLAIERPEPADARPLVDATTRSASSTPGIELGLRDLGRAVFTGGPTGRSGPVGSTTAATANRSSSSTSTARCRRWRSSSTRARGSTTRSTTATHRVGGRDELAHYFRFRQIAVGYRYREGRRQRAPTGPRLAVDWDAVLPMRDDPASPSCLRAARYARSARRSTGPTANCSLPAPGVQRATGRARSTPSR